MIEKKLKRKSKKRFENENVKESFIDRRVEFERQSVVACLLRGLIRFRGGIKDE